MKNKNDFSVQMMRVTGDLTPFVEVGYVDQDANEHTALMVVDSCSCHNLLYGARAESSGVVLQEEEGTIDISCGGNEMLTASLAKMHFALGGEQFHESFCIRDGDINYQHEIDGKPILGILGNLFMQKYRLAIDYSDNTLHASNVSPANLPISACDFFFPMQIGLERYGVPVLAVRQNGNDLVALADTGSTDNMIASQSIIDNSFDCEFLDSTDTIVGIAGETEARNARMKFCLLTLTEGDTDVVPHEGAFKVIPHYLITPEEGQRDKNGVQLPPVVGIIGSPFMAKEGWVLDFGVKYIYKRKTQKKTEQTDPRVAVKDKDERTIGTRCDGNATRRIRFYADATKTGLPFIQIKEGDFKGIVMLIDTGANDNLMFGYAFHHLSDYMKLTDMKSNSFGIEGQSFSLNFATGTMCFFGKEYRMMFLVQENSDVAMEMSKEMGFPIAGIIGTKFMAEHGWIIDFGKQEIIIPASDVTPEDLNEVRNNENSIK